MFQMDQTLRIESFNPIAPFPDDANVRISITGLALCQLEKKTSTINFLSHVEHHELFMAVIQRTRVSNNPIVYNISKIGLGQSISIKSTGSIPYGDIEAPLGDGEHPLGHILNLPTLHGYKLDPLTPPQDPIVLSLNDCAFYTLEITEGFQIIDTDNPTPQNRKIGKIMGGKMNCEVNKETIITVSGNLSFDIKLPQKLAGQEFVYDIVFTNHCTNTEECKELMSSDSDFRFYYQLRQDPKSPRRRMRLKKKPPFTPEVGACMPAIDEPPIALPLP